MKNLLQKTASFLLALFLFTGIAATDPALAHAASRTIYEPSSIETAYAGTPVTKSFTVPQPCDAGILVYTKAPVAFTMTIYNSANAVVDTLSISAADEYWTQTNGSYVNGGTCSLAAGDYNVAFLFESTTDFVLYITANEPDAAISNNKLTLTAGFSKTLSIEGGNGQVTWQSSNPSVANVNSSGKVTAKKAGTCTITASVDGINLKCAVTVKDNKYSATRLTNSQVPSGSASWEAYSASYDSAGNLVIKFRMVNNSGHYSEYLKNLSVKVKTADGKTAASYKASKKNLYVADQGYKDFSITIKKSDLKIQKADLRNASISTDGKYGYVYYTYK